MTKAEELLNSLDETDESLYPEVVEEEPAEQVRMAALYAATATETDEPHVVIFDDRSMYVPDSIKKIGIQFDHDVNLVRFDLPRYSDGVDLYPMQFYVNYIRPDGTPGAYHVEDVTVDETDSTILHFSWHVLRHATEYQGNLTILVCVKETDDAGNLEHHWNTELNTDFYLSEGLECADTILAEYPDIITQLLTEMDVVKAIATPEAMQGYANTWLNQYGAETVRNVEQKGQEVLASIPEDYAQLSNDVNELKGDITNIPLEKKNLISNNEVMMNKIVNAYTHEIIDSTDSFIQILNIKGNTDLAFYHNDKHVNALIHVFDINGNFIQLINTESGSVAKTHVNASYGYYTLPSRLLASATVIESSEPITEYIEQGFRFTEKVRMTEKFIDNEKSFDENVIPTEAIKPRAVTSDKIDSYDIKRAAAFNRKNLFNPDTCVPNKKADMPGYVAENYVENDDDYWCLSDFIPVEEGINYKLNDTLFLYKFDKDKKCIGFINPTATTITIPTGTCYVKVNAHNISQYSNIYTKKYYIFHVIIAKESEYDEAFIETYRKYHTNETVDSLYTQRLYNVNEIYNHWVDGEKFPIAFYGDSTTEGDSTTDSSGTMNAVAVTNNTLGSDYIWESAYPNLLETMMKDMTGNGVLRVYNAGFSGKDSEWAWQNYEKEFGSGTAYEDTKIIFLAFGINDRADTTSLADLYNKTKKFTELLVIKIKRDKKQPVIMTTQPYYSKFSSGSVNERNAQITINRALMMVAEEFNLEIIDRYDPMCNMFVDSDKQIYSYLHTDLLHCNNGGHVLEKDILAYKLIPTIIDIKNKDKIEVSDMCFLSQNLTVNSTKVNGYSMYYNTTTTSGEVFNTAYVYSEKIRNIEPKYLDTMEAIIRVNGVEKKSLDIGLNKIDFVGTGNRIKLMGIDVIN